MPTIHDIRLASNNLPALAQSKSLPLGESIKTITSKNLNTYHGCWRRKLKDKHFRFNQKKI